MSGGGMRADRVQVLHGDSRVEMKKLAGGSVDSCVCDPPYALVSVVKRLGSPTAKPFKGDVYRRSGAGFMGKTWDTGETAFDPDFWREVWRVLKPGGHVVAFSGTRTYHRLACAIEDAGFEIRDQIEDLIASDTRIGRFMDSLNDAQRQAFVQLVEEAQPGGMLAWIYGSGFPKSHDVAKAIDRKLGQPQQVVGEKRSGISRRARSGGEMVGYECSEALKRTPVTVAASDQAKPWQGWGSALKPAQEPIILARKPLDGTVAENVLEHGTGALNIDGCRVGSESTRRLKSGGANQFPHEDDAWEPKTVEVGSDAGRWPANVVHDGSAEVVEGFPAEAGAFAPVRGCEPSAVTAGIYGEFNGRQASQHHGDTGSAARFFYSAKADADDRVGSKHPTVKPVDLMAWLVRLVTPPGGLVLDPFAGSGSTGEAALREGMRAILIEREAEYVADIERRIAAATGAISRAAAKAHRHDPAKRAGADLPLFTGGDPCSAD